MAFEHKPDRGSIFRNDYKTKDSQPTHKGDAKIVCPKCKEEFEAWLSAWVNETKDGAKYFSVAFDPKQEKPAAPPAQQDLDDDIPF
jgi:hypothetical protein